MKKCPHCGGDSGATYTEHGVQIKYWIGWDGSDTENEIDYTRLRPTWARCIECSKRVRIHDIEDGP